VKNNDGKGSINNLYTGKKCDEKVLKENPLIMNIGSFKRFLRLELEKDL